MCTPLKDLSHEFPTAEDTCSIPERDSDLERVASEVETDRLARANSTLRLESQLEAIFSALDGDRSGKLDLLELVPLCRVMRGVGTVAQVEKTLRRMDLDQSGAVNLQEFVRFFAQKCNGLPTSKVTEMLEHIQQTVESKTVGAIARTRSRVGGPHLSRTQTNQILISARSAELERLEAAHQCTVHDAGEVFMDPLTFKTDASERDEMWGGSGQVYINRLAHPIEATYLERVTKPGASEQQIRHTSVVEVGTTVALKIYNTDSISEAEKDCTVMQAVQRNHWWKYGRGCGYVACVLKFAYVVDMPRTVHDAWRGRYTRWNLMTCAPGRILGETQGKGDAHLAGNALYTLLEGARAIFDAGFMPDDITDLNNIMFCPKISVFTWIDVGSTPYDIEMKQFLGFQLVRFMYAAFDQSDQRVSNLDTFRLNPHEFSIDGPAVHDFATLIRQANIFNQCTLDWLLRLLRKGATVDELGELMSLISSVGI